MADLVTWCRIFAVGPACARPCDGCRRTSRDLARSGPVCATCQWPVDPGARFCSPTCAIRYVPPPAEAHAAFAAARAAFRRFPNRHEATP